ncbi:DNA replication/repair protein RecF [Phenylobacterium parvum]|uniref:DNA replication and repair protein RecF n=1 Tax=Phenylobacterium parvum TaxID=2201350 RepID=A0A2Z3HIG7_9CAUL|nr:DNA replication/repair protein RecF [Phenylobacterium parvum]AWM76303.1 DNA replication/repair protein RecF [Phenylobacterium parvum]
MRSVLTRLSLTDFRSYERADIPLDGRMVVLTGPNGAGKTNILEAVSLLSPGRGLRNAALPEIGRRAPDETAGRAWAVSALLEVSGEPVRIGVGVETAGAARRAVRLEGEAVPPARLTDLVRPAWLTPAQDRLFLEAAGERRRFLDRLVFAAEPAHAAHAQAYEKALRERLRLLTDGPADGVWLDALEQRLALSGARLAEARARTLAVLQAEIDARGDRPFPQARIAPLGEWEKRAAGGESGAALEQALAAALAAARGRDGTAGRSLTGPHRGDLSVIHAERGRPAAECSTGEQKALVLNLVLAQAARLSRAESAPAPVLLLDEVAAHLDRRRRAALFDEIEALGLQAFLTGTDDPLFEELAGRALRLRVEGSRLAVADTP